MAQILLGCTTEYLSYIHLYRAKGTSTVPPNDATIVIYAIYLSKAACAYDVTCYKALHY